MTPDPRKNAKTTRGRPFTKGNAGRPPGTRNRASMAVEALLEGEADKLGRKVIDLALEGDIAALRMCLDRISPPRRERAVTIALPTMQSAIEHPQALSAVIQAMAVGEITPREAASICAVLSEHRSALEGAVLEARIAALEQLK